MSVATTKPKRMVLSSVTNGRVKKPILVFLYGIEKIGKSTFGAQAPKPIFIGPEDGTSGLDTSRFPCPETWQDVTDAIDELLNGEHDYQTVVIDTVDWLEALCIQSLCAAAGVKTIEDLGKFGKGHIAVLEEFRGLIKRLDKLRQTRKMNVVLLGHAVIKPFNNPDGDNYDRYLPKGNEKITGLICEWVEDLLFANYETFVDKENAKARKGKGVGNVRKIYTQRRPAFQAGSRNGLPPEIALSWNDFAAGLIRGEAEVAEKLRREASIALDELSILAPEKAEKAKAAIVSAGDDVSRLNTLINTIKQRIAEHTPE